MTDVLATWTGRQRRRGWHRGGSRPTATGARLRPLRTADDGQIALGVLSEQHFWSSLCAELGVLEEGDLSFEERSARGPELQRNVAAAIARRNRDEWWTRSPRSAVPVAPVLDRPGMLASAPFPEFPIRLAPPRGLRRGARSGPAPRPRILGTMTR